MADPATDSRARSIALKVAQIAVTVAVTWFILGRLGVSWDAVQNLDPRWWRPEPVRLALASAVLMGGYALSSVLWARMAHDLGGRLLPARRAIPLFMTANLGRYLPGKVWQILGLAYLSRSQGVGGKTAGAAAVLGQVFALAAAGAVGMAAFGAGTVAPPWLPWAAGGGALLALFAFGVEPIRRRAFEALAGWSGTTLEPGRVGASFGLRWAAYYGFNWVIYAAAFWIFMTSYQPELRFLETGPAFAAAYFIGYVFLPAPAGLGVREGALASLLSGVVGAPAAVAVAATSRLWTTLVELLPAAAMTPGVLRRARTWEREEHANQPEASR